MAAYAKEQQNFTSTALQSPLSEKPERSSLSNDAEGQVQTGQTMQLKRRLQPRHLQMSVMGMLERRKK